MTWLNIQQTNWLEPLLCAQLFAEHDIALLYSGLEEEKTGGISYLYIDPISVAQGDDWSAFSSLDLQDVESPVAPDWVGYLGYELAADTLRAPRFVDMPVFRFVRYQHVLKFDHHEKSISHASRNGDALTFPATANASPSSFEINRIASNFTRAHYETSVANTVERIHAGDFYQANITRKFFGEFKEIPDSFSIFSALAKASPAPYSAYIRHEGSAILSASPECFLRVDADGIITTRPIKGSARRSENAQEDVRIQTELQHSEKNLAENLMIVDLMRNDLAKVSEPQSVTVTEQSGLYSYATIHHLISTVSAKKRPDANVHNIIEACFPPGSMTGAPKKAAMAWCASQEQMARGVYSGAIGWIGAGNACDLSVVIRTLIIRGRQFEFQVGGGIVADSNPTEEWQETLTKARGIMVALGLNEADLAAL